MGLKLFFTYIGSLLAISIALTILVKKLASGYASQGKAPIFYGTFSSIIASLIAFLAIFVSENLFTVFWIFAAIFMLFGIIHLKMVQKKYFTAASKENKVKVFAGELFFALSIVLFTIVVFSSLQYFVTRDKDFIFYPMMLSTLAFFIPTLFFHTFEAAFDIPAAEYFTWEYPVNSPIDLPEDDPSEKLLVIGFEIAKKLSGKKTYFRAKAPENIKLGELFYHFINDYNDLQSETPIEYADQTNMAFEWWFRLKPKWYQSNKILNPNISFRNNGIKENSVIICERIK
ncbi:hypothetical protein BH10BAC3_BH10BAC3_36420 [soil metagenome]